MRSVADEFSVPTLLHNHAKASCARQKNAHGVRWVHP